MASEAVEPLPEACGGVVVGGALETVVRHDLAAAQQDVVDAVVVYTVLELCHALVEFANGLISAELCTVRALSLLISREELPYRAGVTF